MISAEEGNKVEERSEAAQSSDEELFLSNSHSRFKLENSRWHCMLTSHNSAIKHIGNSNENNSRVYEGPVVSVGTARIRNCGRQRRQQVSLEISVHLSHIQSINKLSQHLIEIILFRDPSSSASISLSHTTRRVSQENKLFSSGQKFPIHSSSLKFHKLQD